MARLVDLVGEAEWRWADRAGLPEQLDDRVGDSPEAVLARGDRDEARELLAATRGCFPYR